MVVLLDIFRRRRGKSISTSWWRKPIHAVKKASGPRRVLSGLFVMSFITGAGIIVLLVLGLFMFPWYIRLLSELAFGVGAIMGMFDLGAAALLYRNGAGRKLVGAFGGFSMLYLVFLVVAICGELNLYYEAGVDILVFICVVGSGVGRFVSLCLLVWGLFLSGDGGKTVDPVSDDE
jgi:hypothetical protein